VEPALPLPEPDGGDVSLTPDGGIADGDAFTAVEPALPLPEPDGGDVSLTPDGGIADGDAFTPMPDGPTDDVSILGVGAATIRLPEGGAYCMHCIEGGDFRRATPKSARCRVLTVRGVGDVHEHSRGIWRHTAVDARCAECSASGIGPDLRLLELFVPGVGPIISMTCAGIFPLASLTTDYCPLQQRSALLGKALTSFANFHVYRAKKARDQCYKVLGSSCVESSLWLDHTLAMPDADRLLQGVQREVTAAERCALCAAQQKTLAYNASIEAYNAWIEAEKSPCGSIFGNALDANVQWERACKTADHVQLQHKSIARYYFFLAHKVEDALQLLVRKDALELLKPPPTPTPKRFYSRRRASDTDFGRICERKSMLLLPEHISRRGLVGIRRSSIACRGLPTCLTSLSSVRTCE
jgi:hypothetical protein